MRTMLAITFGVIAAVAALIWALLQFGLDRSVASAPAPVEIAAEAPAPAPVAASAPIAVEPTAPAISEPVEVAPESAGAPAATSDDTLESNELEAETSDTLESDRLDAPQPRLSEVFEVARSATGMGVPNPRAIVGEDPAVDAPQLESLEPAAGGAVPVVEAASAPAAPAESPAAAVPEPAPVDAPASLAEQFKSRQVTYNRPPKTLSLGRPIDVSLVINATDDPSAGADALQGFSGTIVERDVDLSDIVSAQLTGVGFEIVSQSVERQRLSQRTINRWQWRVTPTEPGTRTLILEIFGYASGSLDAEPLDAYRDEIVVEVRELERLMNIASAYQPAFAAIAGLSGLASALFGLLRFRNERRRGA